ncbi:MAG: nitroreductase family protein [Dehalobacterium sp.]
MEFNDVILMRRTTRSYEPHQISAEDLNTLLMAAHMAPIAGGDYTMTHMTVVQDAGLLNELRQACMMKLPGKEEHIDAFYGAPTVIFFSARGISKDCIEYSNIGCAIENMLLAATDRHLGSTYLWGCLRKLRPHPELIGRLQLPEGYEILSAVAVGYPTDPLVKREPVEKISVNRI